MAEEITGQVLEVLICNDENSMLSTAVDTVDVTFDGFVGEKHSGMTKLSDGRTKFYPRGTLIRNSRQVSIVSKEEIEEICKSLDIEKILPEWVGANLLLSGIPNMTDLKPNVRLFFSSGAVLLITADNLPCVILTREIVEHIPSRPDLTEKLIPAAMGKRGLVAVVELPGQIKKGDSVRVVYTQR
jgi:hypothetical protein